MTRERLALDHAAALHELRAIEAELDTVRAHRALLAGAVRQCLEIAPEPTFSPETDSYARGFNNARNAFLRLLNPAVDAIRDDLQRFVDR